MLVSSIIHLPCGRTCYVLSPTKRQIWNPGLQEKHSGRVVWRTEAWDGKLLVSIKGSRVFAEPEQDIFPLFLVPPPRLVECVLLSFCQSSGNDSDPKPLGRWLTLSPCEVRSVGGFQQTGPLGHTSHAATVPWPVSSPTVVAVAATAYS